MKYSASVWLAALTAAALLAPVAAEVDDSYYQINTNKPYTNTFNLNPDSYYTDGEVLTSTSQIGLILGFVALGVFLLYAFVMVIRDEWARHEDFKKKVADALNELRSRYQCDAREIENYERDFDEAEARGHKTADDGANIAEIN